MKLLINGNSICEIINERMTMNEIFKLDKAIGHLKRNKKKYLQLVVVLAYLFFFCPDLVLALDKIETMGYEIIKKIQLYAGIVACVMAVIELAGELIKGGRNNFQIIFKYGVGYIALLLVPTIFETIRSLF